MRSKPRDIPENITLGVQRLDELRNMLAHQNRVQYLAELIEREPHLELITPWTESSLCFRYVCDGIDELDLAGINRMILYELWHLKQTMLDEDKVQGKYVIKASNIEKSSCLQDLDILIEQFTSIGDVLVREYL
jgi:hypothetical protein